MPAAKPKYSLIAEQLMRDIKDGTLPVGALMPTETELMRAYGVSRYTVRSALQTLREQGVIASRQGHGSRVVAGSGTAAFAEKIQSIDELITFGQETRRKLLSHRTVEADAALAELFGCVPGRRLSEARMIRESLGNPATKIALVTLWVDALLGPVVASLEEMQKSAAEIIQERYGHVTGSVVQTVQADVLDAASAAVLEAEVGAPALIVTRSYCEAQKDEPFLIARSVCKADSFRVVSRFTAPAG